jgi:hypothetical protein
MKYNYARIGGIAAETVKITAGDTSASLKTLIDAAVSSPVDWNLVRAIEIHVEDNDCRIAFGTDAANGATPVGGLRYVGQRERIPSYPRLMVANVINATAGSNAVIMVDVESQTDY